ncbi:hypothetical protein Y032_0352g3266 [Ancylostoma ceylanicum]|uniref:SCP domain-containing protein n=1 Tax=Ancylostoma ceylanicum TaxID=53326 RepID=A0A016RWL8_9BILA|nr:hypothetical protein Y032_0352g3266 [Ancylostoma ceylanicum]
MFFAVFCLLVAFVVQGSADCGKLAADKRSQLEAALKGKATYDCSIETEADQLLTTIKDGTWWKYTVVVYESTKPDDLFNRAVESWKDQIAELEAGAFFGCNTSEEDAKYRIVCLFMS